MHDVAFDARLLAESGIALANVHDTAVAARMLSRLATGLATLLDAELGVHIGKTMQQHDWRVRPLDDRMLDYLAADVVHLEALEQTLWTEVGGRGIEDAVLEETRYRIASAIAATQPPEVVPPYARVKGAGRLAERELAVLRVAAELREREAERRDVPPHKIAPADALIAIARARPTTAQELARVRGFPTGTPAGRAFAAALLPLLATAGDRIPEEERHYFEPVRVPAAQARAAPPARGAPHRLAASGGEASRGRRAGRPAGPLPEGRRGCRRRQPRGAVPGAGPRGLPRPPGRRGDPAGPPRRRRRRRRRGTGVSSLLVVAGEASGDRAAAAVIARLPGVDAFGLGGPALASAGTTLVGDLRASTALGVGEAGMRAWGVLRAWGAVVRAAKRRKPRAALLVNYSEFNARLAPQLRDAGVRVLWYGAPQVWAWRGSRTTSLRRCVDRMAVMLPFECPIWRSAGVDAHYVGHPSLETVPLDRDTARRALGMTPYAATVAVLPGSRPHEVRRLLVPMLDAYERVRADRASVDARVLVASSLDESTRRWLRDLCAARRVGTFEVDPSVGAMAVLRAFDAALCASGTASLEAALARAVPVVAYRVGVTTELAAQDARDDPEHRAPQRPARVAARSRSSCSATCRPRGSRRRWPTRSIGAPRSWPRATKWRPRSATQRTPSIEVARMLAPWLGVRARAA